MAINYNSLIGSETKLKEYFFNFIELNYSLHKKVWELILKGKLNSETMEELLHNEEMSNNLEKDILDECVWIISKDQPRASHLRFIISIIYSAKDLERISDYAINIAKPFLEVKLNKEEKYLFGNISDEYISAMKKIISLIKKENTASYYQEGKQVKKAFSDFYANEFKKIIKEHKNNFKHLDKILYVLKSIDRTIDHFFNVFTNFKFVRSDSISKTKNIDLNKG